MRRTLLALPLLLAAAPAPADEAPVSFRNEVVPILTRLGCNSGACHGSAAGKNGLKLSLRGYAPELDHDALTRQVHGRRVNLEAPSESLLLLKGTGTLQHGGGPRLDPASPEFALLARWIAEGAPGPRESDPRVVRVEAVPRTTTAAVGDSAALRVEATYSDGTTRDVTRWAKFDSADASVARIDEAGRFTVTGHGEGALSVWFASTVDLARVAAPRPGPVDEAAFAAAPVRNLVDRLNLEKLRSLNVPPSPQADDATFLRRATLDAAGRLPTPEEVDAYLADADPEKRDRLVDRLLASPEFVDAWSYKWSDLLLVSSKQLPAPALWAFSRFVREAVASDTPWDEFARRVVTARGSTLANGAANYFVLHRDTVDLAESTSVAFLGLSLTCARCHDHPLEKWTQDQYYGFANLFSRVALKDGPAGSGDVVVSASNAGDILHPRRQAPVAPQPLDGEALGLGHPGDRRAAFADWLADPSNPYFDRAIVNRVWAHFLGRGLVDPEDDLRATNPASDPALLDALVADFRAHGRSVRHLIRTVMTSGVYGRSSAPLPGNAEDAKFHSRFVPRRLPAEVLLDAIDQVTGVPTPFAGYPAGWRSLQLPDSKVASPFLDAFGRAPRESVCSCERSEEPSIAQALHLANGTTLNEKLRVDSGRIARWAASGMTDAEVVDRLVKSALGRPPDQAERAALVAPLAEAGADPAARRQALEDVAWSVLTSKQFLFNH
jgi:hypothetical protein